MNTAVASGVRNSGSGAAVKLNPKEHGAYAILGVPLATSILLAGPTLVGMLVVVASIAAFFAHEPLLVACQHRGKRAQAATPAAQQRLVLLAAVTVGCTALAALLGSDSVRIALLGAGLLASIAIGLAVAGKHRSLAGQIVGVLGLSAPSLPIALSRDGTEWAQLVPAAEVWVTWMLGFAAAIVSVRGIIAFQKHRPRTYHWVAIILLTMAFGTLLCTPLKLTATALPLLALAWYLMISPPAARLIKRVGWMFVCGAVATGLGMAACY